MAAREGFRIARRALERTAAHAPYEETDLTTVLRALDAAVAELRS
jgi:hypothetical protein